MCMLLHVARKICHQDGDPVDDRVYGSALLIWTRERTLQNIPVGCALNRGDAQGLGTALSNKTDWTEWLQGFEMGLFHVGLLNVQDGT